MGRAEAAGPPLAIEFYTRAGCPCCDKAKAMLEELAQRFPLQVKRRDVDADPAWAEQYGREVPVLVVGGRKRFWGRIEPALLERFVRHETMR